jgi:hypothetical protein
MRAGDRLPNLFLPGMILADRNGHQLFERQGIVSVEVEKLRRD